MIEFAGNGKPYSGYLSPSATGSGPGVIVIQEWWGLVGHIKEVADRFAEAGFTALAPDFYHGKSTTEPDEAGSMLMALNIEDAAKVIHGAVEALLSHPATSSNKAGVVGFCMGGQLSMFAACIEPKIGASVNFYGIHPNVHPDFASLQCPMLGFFAEIDDLAPPEKVKAMDDELTALGKDHEFIVFQGAKHAFFNDGRPEVHDPEVSRQCWDGMVEFFRRTLG